MSGLIQAVLTDDSDAMVFGSSMVLRIRPDDNEKYTATLFSSKVLDDAGLGNDKLVLIALLAGGDYSVCNLVVYLQSPADLCHDQQDGLPGCGIQLAHALAHAGLGHALIYGIEHASNEAEFVKRWVSDLRHELCENTSGFLARKQPHVASRIPADFPDLKILHLYLHPLTSEFGGGPLIPLVSHGGPDPLALAKYSQKQFAWNSGILRYLASWVFPGMAVRELVAQATRLDHAQAQHPIRSLFFGPVLWYRERPVTSGLPELRVHLTVDEALLASIVDAVACDPVERIRAWVPLAMVQHVFPEWLEKPITNLPVQATCELIFLLFIQSFHHSFTHLQLILMVHPAPQTWMPLM